MKTVFIGVAYITPCSLKEPLMASRKTLMITTLLLSASPLAAQTFRNDIGRIADPFITVSNGTYYETGTTYPISVRSSSSVATLKDAPLVGVFSDCGQHSTLYNLSGKWYIYYNNCTNISAPFTIDVVSSDSPDGTFGDKHTLPIGGYDQSLFEFAGQLYMFYSTSDKIWIQKMSDPLTLDGTPTIIATVDQPWEGELIEAPVALEHNLQISVTYAANNYNSNRYGNGLLVYSCIGTAGLVDGSCWKKQAGPVYSGNGVDAFGAGVIFPFKSPDGSQDYFVSNAFPNDYYAPTSGNDRLDRVEPFYFDSNTNLPVFPRNAATFDTDIPLPSGDPGPPPGP